MENAGINGEVEVKQRGNKKLRGMNVIGGQ